jgi:hypothetical protein
MAMPAWGCRKNGASATLGCARLAQGKDKVAENRQSTMTNPQHKLWPKIVMNVHTPEYPVAVIAFRVL